MRILVASDICWERDDYSFISENTKQSKLKKRKCIIQNFEKAQEIIFKEKPDLILLLGDLISDGSHSYTHEKLLAKLLKGIKTNVILIRGNHDYSPEWEYLINQVKKNEKIVNLQSNVIQFNSFNFLGVPYESTHSKIKLREIFKKNYKVDFLLAHVEGSRRIWLTDILSKIIISGHSGYGYFFTPEGNMMFFTGGFPFEYNILDISNINVIDFYVKSSEKQINIKYNIDLQQRKIIIFDKINNCVIDNINLFIQKIDTLLLDAGDEKILTGNGFLTGKDLKDYISSNQFEIYKREKHKKEQENLFLILKNIRKSYYNNNISKQDLLILKDKYKISEKHIKDYILTNPYN